MRLFFPLLTIAALLPFALPRSSARLAVAVAWTQAALVDAAAVHVSSLSRQQAKHARYVALNAVPPAKRLGALKALSLAMNLLSRADDPALPEPVAGTDMALAWIDLAAYGIDPDAFDVLGKYGSGPSPQPEPYFHAVAVTEKVVVTEAEGHYTQTPTTTYDPRYGGYVTTYARTWVPGKKTETLVKRRDVALAPHLNRATAVGLAEATGSTFPVFELRWLVANALVEPRYHELLGMDDTEASAKRLAGLNERDARRAGATVRGAVLFSEVAHHNRVLERTPTLARFGRGSYHESYDFKSSVKVQDVLKDLLNERPDAKEVIFTLPNGLPGFFVVDAKGKRLDKADGDVALNNRSRFRDRQVRTAFHCVACHLPDKGWIEVDDELRRLSLQPVTLLADAFTKDGAARGKEIKRRYLSLDYNELLQADQAVVEASVQAATKAGDGRPLTCPEAAKLLVDLIWDNTDRPVTLDDLAAETGYSRAAIDAACRTAGVDPVFVAMAAGRKGRRDQVEAGWAGLVTVLKGAVK